MIKTFRGKLDDGGQQRIRLSTKKGKVGYRIIKFLTISAQPSSGGNAGEHFTMLWKVKQSSISTTTPAIDFADGNLLGVNWSPNNAERPFANSIIFDQEIFNQDIYISHMDIVGTQQNNYYLELETINMSDNATIVSTLRDIRLNPQVGA